MFLVAGNQNWEAIIKSDPFLTTIRIAFFVFLQVYLKVLEMVNAAAVYQQVFRIQFLKCLIDLLYQIRLDIQGIVTGQNSGDRKGCDTGSGSRKIPR